MVFVLDNYDSFTYNLVQYLAALGQQVEVRRNDELSVTVVERMRPQGIVISPGPGTPESAGISVALIRHMAGKTPILGVCLGHQAIGAAFGGKIVRAHRLMHGKTSQIRHDGRGVFAALPSPLAATRYHSLIVDDQPLPAELEASAYAEDTDGTKVLMGLRHKRLPIEGVQFHPESILTEHGPRIIQNFLDLAVAK